MDQHALSDYHKKRDFKKTPEPEGGDSDYGSFPVFVIQKHSATRLHYDFRIEHKGVLVSWAVPKKLSLDPQVKRLAVMTEDHPFDYRNFEGTIPKGNYGAGEVIVWDEGNFTMFDAKNKTEIDRRISKGLAEGRLTLILNGKKVKGEFNLIRQGEEKEWLLLKKKDEFVSKKDLTELDNSVLSPISLSDERGGRIKVVPEKIIGAKKSLIPKDLRPMSATPVKQPFDSKEWIYEIKWDGYRVIAEIFNKKAELYSRNRNYFTEKYREISRSLKKIKGDVILDGEAVVLDKEGKADFQRLQIYDDVKKGLLVYMVFDVLYFEGYDLRGSPLNERKKILKYILPEDPHLSVSEFIEEQGKSFFALVTKQGIEGIVAKEKNSLYLDGKRSSQWLKIKAKQEQEALICGYTSPAGGRHYFGSLVLGEYKDEELRYIGNVGTGFDEPSLRKIKTFLDNFKTGKSPFKNPPEIPNILQWVKPEVVCQVGYAERTQEGIMRQPVFMGLREDKEPDEVVEELPREAAVPHEAHVSKVRITNREKIFWPEDRITKGQLLDYYEKLSEVILPYLADRPENLNRFPDGINGGSFYQKNAVHVPKWVDTVKLRSDNEGRDINYILCNDKKSLLYLINLGCIELNPWNSKTSSLDRPDYLIMDLDPEEIEFRKVVDTALVVKDIFDDLEIPSYSKTSGATGLHIYVPLGAEYSYDQVRKFAEIIAGIAHSRSPKWTSIRRDPKKRQGKVYLDYLQNRIGQTLAAPYCVRPKPHATVSMPLEWREVTRDLSPGDFTIKNSLERIYKKGDLWKPVLGKGISISDSLQRLQSKFSKFL